MSVPIALLLLAVAVMTIAPRVLTRGAWTSGAPRCAIVAWQASIGAVLASFVLLAVAAALPVEGVSLDVGHLLHACAAVLRDRYEVHGSAWVAGASAVLATAAIGFLLGSAVLCATRVARGRARQRRLIDLLAREQDGDGAHVLPHDVPLAYCIPGRRGRIVLTSAAKTMLGEDELAAVLAHERAHLHGRHDLVLFGVDVARRAFPWSGFFAVARRETAGLVEMLADDRAACSRDPEALAAALVGLGAQPAPPGALGVAASMTYRRATRLVESRRRPSRLHRVGVLTLSAGLLLAPWVIVVAPAWAVMAGHCPPPTV